MPNQQPFVVPDPDRDPGGFVNLLAGSPPASVALPGQSQPSSDSGLPGGGAAGLHVPAHRHQQEHLPAKIEDILNLAAAVFGEASTQRNAKEEQAIANTIMNIRKASGNSASVTEFLKKHRHVIQGYHPHSGFMTAMRTRLQGGHFPADPARDQAIRHCLEAAMKALPGPNQEFDNSEGAYFWLGQHIETAVKDGAPEIARTEELIKNSQNKDTTDKLKHKLHRLRQENSELKIYNQGILMHEGHNTFDLPDKKNHTVTKSGSYDYIFETTQAYGGTIFYRYTQEYKNATGYPRNWP